MMQAEEWQGGFVWKKTEFENGNCLCQEEGEGVEG